MLFSEFEPVLGNNDDGGVSAINNRIQINQKEFSRMNEMNFVFPVSFFEKILSLELKEKRKQSESDNLS